MSGPDRRQLAAIVAEVDARRGARVQSVHQTGKLCFRLSLQDRRERIDLVLDLDPEAPRLYLAPRVPAPPAPSPLASGLRRALRGAHLEGALAVRGERAVALAFRRGDERHTLWFEGFGHGANLYLVDGRDVVRLTPRGRVAARRGARVGDPFVPASPREVEDPRPAGAVGTGSPAACLEAERERAARELEDLRREVLRELRRSARRLERRLERLATDASRAAEAAGHRHRGTLLQASFHLLRPGLDRIRVPDPTLEPAGEVEIPLDPRLAPAAQVAACFRAARKAERAAREADVRRPAVEAEMAAVREALDAASRATDPSELRALAPARGDADRPESRARPWATYESADGWRILVGRNARANDLLTTRQAHPGDLFLHVRGGSGSHVIVPTPRGKTVPRDTLLDAAWLAWWFSGLRRATSCEVEYALKRHVRKPRKAAPGTVVVERGRTLRLRPDARRHRRLLASRRK